MQNKAVAKVFHKSSVFCFTRKHVWNSRRNAHSTVSATKY